MERSGLPIKNPDLPRIIIWHIAPAASATTPAAPSPEDSDNRQILSMSECLLIIDSIARTSKPIVVLTGDRVLGQYTRLPELLEYGRALGLKMIVEATPPELTDDVLRRFSYFGERIFRIRVDDLFRNNPDGRIEDSPLFGELEDCIERLEKSGYEAHLVFTMTKPDVRRLALIHDYAIRRSARGLYCHLRFDLMEGRKPRGDRAVDQFIKRFATLKEYSPASMIVSPQCVKFIHHHVGRPPGGRGREISGNGWDYSCLAGKSYAFINDEGYVQLCGGNGAKGTFLREVAYDFRKIWTGSQAFSSARKICRTCLHGYHPSMAELGGALSEEGNVVDEA